MPSIWSVGMIEGAMTPNLPLGIGLPRNNVVSEPEPGDQPR